MDRTGRTSSIPNGGTASIEASGVFSHQQFVAGIKYIII
jgi:hypothetical protein